MKDNLICESTPGNEKSWLENKYLQSEVKPECKGLVFRGYNSSFIKGNHIGNRQGIKLLKRKSCSGCVSCDSALEYLAEDMGNNRILPEIEHGKLYSLRWVDDGTDWETGYKESHVEIY